MPADQRIPSSEALEVLAHGEVEVEGRMPWSSNGTFLVTCRAPTGELAAIYKPHRGERPLWDFPGGLYRREVAAYELSVVLGWGQVPETVLRPDAPLGVGSLQRFVPADFSQHYFTLMEAEENHDALREICAFDLLVNNADRKAGHCLAGLDGRIWAIDNGLCFHVEPKLRTVIWDFAGEELPARLLEGLERLAGAPPECLEGLLAPDDARAVSCRAATLLAHPRLPAPDPELRPYPWPLV
ncbi:MAG: SCO1664 family protein [Acidimicrobiales bacterium]